MASGGSCEDPLKGYQLGGHRLYDERQGTALGERTYQGG